MSDKEFKKYDSDDNYTHHNARLSQDPEVREYDGKKFVKLKFASDTRGKDKNGNDRYSTMWVEATVTDYDSEMAAMLKKGDVLTIEGKPALRLWGDDNENASFELVRARLHAPVSLKATLKERGFSPGGAKPAAKPTKGGKAKKKIVEIPEDDDE